MGASSHGEISWHKFENACARGNTLELVMVLLLTSLLAWPPNDAPPPSTRIVSQAITINISPKLGASSDLRMPEGQPLIRHEVEQQQSPGPSWAPTWAINCPVCVISTSLILTGSRDPSLVHLFVFYGFGRLFFSTVQGPAIAHRSGYTPVDTGRA